MANSQTLATPDVTSIQKLVLAIGVFIGALCGVLKAFGIDLTFEQIKAIGEAWVATGAVLIAADAVIRHGRANAAAAKALAAAKKK